MFLTLCNLQTPYAWPSAISKVRSSDVSALSPRILVRHRLLANKESSLADSAWKNYKKMREQYSRSALPLFGKSSLVWAGEFMEEHHQWQPAIDISYHSVLWESTHQYGWTLISGKRSAKLQRSFAHWSAANRFNPHQSPCPLSTWL